MPGTRGYLCASFLSTSKICKGASIDQHLTVLTSAETASTVHNSCSHGLSDPFSPVKNAAAGIKDGESNERKTGDTCFYTGRKEQLSVEVTG